MEIRTSESGDVAYFIRGKQIPIDLVAIEFRKKIEPELPQIRIDILFEEEQMVV